MSTNHFARSNRTTPQRNANKSQQTTQPSTNPSFISNTTTNQNTNNSYVYRPPTRTMKSNINPINQPVKQNNTKIQQKKQQTVIQTQAQSQVKSFPFVRKPVGDGSRISAVDKTHNEDNSTQFIKEEVKPNIKPVSRLTSNRNSDPLAMGGLAPSKIQQATQEKVIPSRLATKANQPKKPLIDEKPQIKSNINIQSSQPRSSQHLEPNSLSSNNLNTKKSPPFTYPKRISRKQPQPESQSQQNIQTTNQYEQTKQQTPKFNRLPDEQKKPTVSNFQLQRKNVNSAPGSQSANNLKPYQNTLQAPIQRIDTSSKNSSSKASQSPSKSSISHASRYSNKIEKNIQSPTKQQRQSEQQTSKTSIKRSLLVAFSLHRLYSQKVQSSFSHIDKFSKHINQRKSKFHQNMQRTLTKFAKNYQRNALMRGAFGLMKSINSKAVKLQMTRSIDPKISNQLILNKNQCFGRVFLNIVGSEQVLVKQAFSTIKQIFNERKTFERKVEYGAKVIGNVESSRMRHYMKELCKWSKVNNKSRRWTLARCSQINIKYKKYLLRQAFTKIQLFKLKQLTSNSKTVPKKPSLNSESPSIPSQLEQPQANLELKTRLSQLQTKLSNLQQATSQIPKQSDLRKTILDLKEQKQISSLQLTTKKQRNNQMKQMLNILMNDKAFNSQQQFDLTSNKMQTQESTLSLLHQVYMKTYKQSEEECIEEENVNSLYSIHRVEENKEIRQIVAKWIAIKENLTLKHQIDLYEGNYVNQNTESQALNNRRKAQKQLEEENEIVKKFIRSYIKERYMWQEVKQYVAAVIVE